MKEDPTFAVLVAAVPGSVRFYKEERTEAGKQFSDVGIAEEHAITMAAGMSRNGGKPVFAIGLVLYDRIGGTRLGYLQVMPESLKFQIQLPVRDSHTILVY